MRVLPGVARQENVLPDTVDRQAPSRNRHPLTGVRPVGELWSNRATAAGLPLQRRFGTGPARGLRRQISTADPQRNPVRAGSACFTDTTNASLSKVSTRRTAHENNGA